MLGVSLSPLSISVVRTSKLISIGISNESDAQAVQALANTHVEWQIDLNNKQLFQNYLRQITRHLSYFV